VLKVNLDGAFQPQTRQGGWGFIVRDETGHVRGAGAGQIKYASSALHAEAQACSEALQATAFWGMGVIQLETDSMILVKALQGSDYDRAPEGVLFRDMRISMQLNFSSCKIGYVPRSCNIAADKLASFGSTQEESRLLWLDYVPDAVNVIVASEYAEPS
jgi:ribonuclease HI